MTPSYSRGARIGGDFFDEEGGGARGQAVYKVHIDTSEVLYALVNLGLAYNKIPFDLFAQRGREWVEAVRAVTPVGLPRELPPHLAIKIPRPMASSAPTSLSQFELEGIRALSEAKKQVHRGDPEHNSRARLAKAEALLREGSGGYDLGHYSDNEADAGGSLRESIKLRVTKARRSGFMGMEVYSNNYYAGFVDQGFQHALAPMFQRADENKKLLPMRSKVYANLQVARTGAYPFTSFMDSWGGESGEIMYSGFAWSGSGDDKVLDPGNPRAFVSFELRQNAAHQDGVRFMEKGTTAWLTSVMPGWQRDVERMVNRVFNDASYPLTWHENERQQRVSKGLPGAGQFAGKALRQTRGPSGG